MITIDTELGMDVVEFYCGLYNIGDDINVEISDVDDLCDYGYCIVNDKHYEIEIRSGLKIVDYVLNKIQNVNKQIIILF